MERLDYQLACTHKPRDRDREREGGGLLKKEHYVYPIVLAM